MTLGKIPAPSAAPRYALFFRSWITVIVRSRSRCPMSAGTETDNKQTTSLPPPIAEAFVIDAISVAATKAVYAPIIFDRTA